MKTIITQISRELASKLEEGAKSCRLAKGHPRNDPNRPLIRVFYTRSPARPNPLGVHPVTVREIDGTRVKIGPIEVFDATPVVDIKSASTRADG